MRATEAALRRAGKTELTHQAWKANTVDAARTVMNSIRVGVCNADGCEARTEVNDVFCTEDFRRLPKALRDELRRAREIVRRNGGRARVNAEAAYKMRIVGARLWLKKNVEAKP